jgi:hypothetical protein
VSSVLAVSVDPNTPGWIVLGIFSLLFLFLSLWTWRFRRFIAQLLAKHEFDEPSLEAVQNRVELIDRECSEFTFAAERLAKVSFRGQRVSIVCGPVAWSDTITHSYKCVYAIADPEQSHWMRQNSDVFEPAFTGSRDSVFWVNIAELLRQAK